MRAVRSIGTRSVIGIPRSWTRLALATGMALAAVGCSGGDGHPPTFQVKGRVEVGGEPAAGASVIFHRIGGEVAGEAKGEGAEVQPPMASVKTDGSFVVTTYEEGDGAPAGDYAVTVQWNKLIKKGTEAIAGPNVVPKDYAKADTTPLKVSVAAGENPEAVFKIDPSRKR